MTDRQAENTRIPTPAQAEALLEDAARRNPGAWVDHSRTAGRVARAIALACPALDADRAYAACLLHDIGRGRGVVDLRHIVYGWEDMQALGYGGVARVCLTHSFPIRAVGAYAGHNDLEPAQTQWLAAYLDAHAPDDLDRLAQLCDYLAMPGEAVILEKRFVDIVLRKGFNGYTLDKWRAYLSLKDYFDGLAGADVYGLFL